MSHTIGEGTSINGHQGADGEERSLGEVIKDLTNHTQDLVKGEIELVKTEMTANMKHLGAYAALGGAALVFAVGTLIFLGHLIAQAIDESAAEWVGYLVVSVLFGAVTIGLALAAKKGFEKTPVAPTHSVESAKEDIQWVKNHK